MKRLLILLALAGCGERTPADQAWRACHLQQDPQACAMISDPIGDAVRDVSMIGMGAVIGAQFVSAPAPRVLIIPR